MFRTQLYLPENVHHSAKMLAKSRGLSLAELLRKCIERGVVEERERYKKKPLSSLAKLKITGGPKDLSANMDDYLYGGT